ncbi:flavodoxin family protein [Paraglaciecola sp.]|uniref:flavodoxin family protein n=1 Tax=Paraglaciecola sp. TaxID=1920173 RepID=UPI003EF8AE88
MSSVIILGSSRGDGNTAQAAQQLAGYLEAEIVDLNRYTILPYDYEFENRGDDFLELIDHLLTFDNLIFASPIYWYAPSATMKLFIDRLCDLLEIYKSRGRALELKSAAVLSTGAASKVDDCFEQIFVKTFDYFNMAYRGILYCQYAEENGNMSQNISQPKVELFAQALSI